MDKTPISAAQIFASISAGRDVTATKSVKLPNFNRTSPTKRLLPTSSSTSTSNSNSNSTSPAIAAFKPAVLRADKSVASSLQLSDRVYSRPPLGKPLYSVSGYMITIHATDAHSGYWPTDTDSNGPGTSWNQPADASIQLTIWKTSCGEGLARLLKLSDGIYINLVYMIRLSLMGVITNITADPENEPWMITDWPAGYRMYVRHTKKAGSESYPYGTYTVARISQSLRDLFQ